MTKEKIKERSISRKKGRGKGESIDVCDVR